MAVVERHLFCGLYLSLAWLGHKLSTALAINLYGVHVDLYGLGFAGKEPLISRSPSTTPVHFSVYQLRAPSIAANECCVSLEGSEFGSSNCARQ